MVFTLTFTAGRKVRLCGRKQRRSDQLEAEPDEQQGCPHTLHVMSIDESPRGVTWGFTGERLGKYTGASIGTITGLI